jgi:hypothetical protein
MVVGWPKTTNGVTRQEQALLIRLGGYVPAFPGQLTKSRRFALGTTVIVGSAELAVVTVFVAILFPSAESIYPQIYQDTHKVTVSNEVLSVTLAVTVAVVNGTTAEMLLVMYVLQKALALELYRSSRKIRNKLSRLHWEH